MPSPGAVGRDVSPRTSRRGRKRPRRRRWRIAGLSLLVVVLVLVALVGVSYARATVPTPDQLGISQSSTIYYADGRTVLARIGAENRTSVSLSQVPITVQHAVIAAENRSFYSDPGVSASGIGRALWADIRGKDVQGGSTITQQYVKNAYLTDQRTLTRKLKELELAVKLDRSYSKSQILEWYLNTIYYGRGAYGIQTAAQTYFGVPASKLTLAQGAVLAASIRSPALYDPQNHPAAAHARFDYVLSGMVSSGWLTPAQRSATSYPKVLGIGAGASSFNDLSGAKGYIVGQVEDELATHGVSSDELRRGGYRVVTTIDATAQNAAVNAVRTQLAGQPAGLRTALAAVRPGTGAVVAYYGGNKGYGYFDYAAHSYQSGSAIKAYVLATALKRGISVNSIWNGSSPQYFPDRPGSPVYNSGDGLGEQCGACTLAQATAMSLNTVYYAVTSKVGAPNVGRLAAAAGIRTLNGVPTRTIAPSLTNNFGIGQYTVTPLDQADGYATFGAQGVHHEPYFVQMVLRSNGSTRYSHVSDAGNQVFSSTVAGDADYAMEKVITQEAEGGEFDRRLSGPQGQYRPAAAKTGTTQLAAGRSSLANKDAWFCGYTPQLSAAVWLGHDTAQPLVDSNGGEVYGISIPGRIWRSFMNAALAKTPVQDFPDVTFGGSTSGDSGASTSTGGNGPTSAPTTSASASASVSTSTAPSSPTPSPDPAPSSPPPSISSSPTSEPTPSRSASPSVGTGGTP